MKASKSDTSIEKMIHDMKEHVPNFYLMGKSLSQLEQMGRKIVQTLESEEKLDFRGIIKHFSIQMPYFHEEQEAERFLNLLQESVCIARDCYDVFCGVILIACSKRWTSCGPNAGLYRVLRYLCTLQSVCLVVLAPEGEDAAQADQLFSSFCSVGLWIRNRLEEEDIQTCVLSCAAYAKKEGYILPENVQQALQERLSQRRQDVTSNAEAARLWIQQILFNRRLEHGKNNAISLAEVEQLSCVPTKEVQPARIGFDVQKR